MEEIACESCGGMGFKKVSWAKNGHDDTPPTFPDCGACGGTGVMGTMDKDLDAKLYAAALYVITEMWSDTMDTLQRASLANQIVREIERRKIV